MPGGDHQWLEVFRMAASLCPVGCQAGCRGCPPEWEGYAQAMIGRIREKAALKVLEGRQLLEGERRDHAWRVVATKSQDWRVS